LATKWAPYDDIVFLGSAEVFALEYGDWSGHVFDIEADVEWNAFENVGFGIGYVDLGIHG